MSTQNERELLEFGERIGRYGKVAPRPAFRAELRSALLAAPVSFEAPRASRLGWSRVPALRPAVAAILVLALCFVATNLVVDLLQTAVDPRIKRA